MRRNWQLLVLATSLGLIFFLDLAALPGRYVTAVYVIPILYVAHQWRALAVSAVGAVAVAANLTAGLLEGATPAALLVDLIALGAAAYLATRLSQQAEVQAHRASAAQHAAGTLSTLIETLPVAVMVADVTGAVTLANRAARELLGEDSDNAYGFHGAALARLDGSPFPSAELPLARALERGEATAEVQLLLRRAPESERIISAAGAPVLDGNSKVVGAVGVFADITEQYHVDMALRESEARYRRMVETAGEGVWVLDAEHNTRFANQRLAEMLGVPLDDLWGQPLLSFTDDEGRALAVAHLRDARHGPRQYDFKLRRRDGSALWVIVSTTPIRGPDGVYGGLLAMLTDITQRKQAEQTRDEYLGLITHDLRQPLTVIQGMAEWLHRDLERQGLAREAGAAESMVKSARRMAGMIYDLVDTVRMEAGNLALSRQPVELPDFLREVVERLGPGQTRVRLELDAPVPALVVDSARLERALLNLLTNALKYSPADSLVVVSTREQDGELWLAVRDEGVGIPRDEQARLFERFYRASTGKHFEGLGLGLYITRLIVEAHGGRVWVESEAGHGSTFRLALPLVGQACPTPEK